jgi:hypothetical protein
MAIITLSPRSSTEDVARALDPEVARMDLVALAAHRDMRVRAAVASRIDAPMASLISLAHEDDLRVREALVANPSSPLWVIRTLAADRRPQIRGRAFARLRVLNVAA